MTPCSRTKEFERVSFKGATIRSCDVSGLVMRGVDLDGLDVDSHDLFFGTLIVNGVDVVPFVDAELNRLFPGRELQKAQTPEGLGEGWAAVQAAWAKTVDETPAALRDAQLEQLKRLRAGQVRITSPFGPVTMPEHPSLWSGLILIGQP